jgi:hypothetical protein
MTPVENRMAAEQWEKTVTCIQDLPARMAVMRALGTGVA